MISRNVSTLCALSLSAFVGESLAQTGNPSPGGQHQPWGQGYSLSSRIAISLGGSFSKLSLDSVPDLTGDGRRELAVGIPELDQVRLYNPRSGALLYTRSGASNSSFGWDVAVSNVLGPSGFPILVVGSPEFPQATPPGNTNPGTPGVGFGGAVWAFGLGPTYSVILGGWGTFEQAAPPPAGVQQYPQSGTSLFYGETVAIGPDLNQDGLPEFLVGHPSYTINGASTGYVEAISIAGPAPIFVDRAWGLGFSVEMGRSIAVMDDLNLDGFPEVAYGEELSRSVTIRDAQAGVCWSRISASAPLNSLFARDIANVGDITGSVNPITGQINPPDGIADLVVGEPSLLATNGEVHVFSGADLGAGCPGAAFL